MTAAAIVALVLLCLLGWAAIGLAIVGFWSVVPSPWNAVLAVFLGFVGLEYATDLWKVRRGG